MEFIQGGRYHHLISDFLEYIRDVRLRSQCEFEYQWAIHLAKYLNYKLVPKQNFNFTEELKNKILQKEKEISHDVKAIELVVAETFFDPTDHHWIHAGLTSEDTNSYANHRLIRDCDRALDQNLDLLCTVLSKLQEILQPYYIAARTHGQPAIPTTWARRIKVYLNNLTSLPYDLISAVKLGGAIGDFQEMTHLGLTKESRQLLFAELYKTLNVHFDSTGDNFQSSLYLDYARHFYDLSVLCSLLLKMTGDFWQGFTLGEFKLVIDKARVGSSVMPQKVNPVNLENAMGQLQMAQGLAVELARDLPVFRLERDISDSVKLRNIPTIYAYLIAGIKMLVKDLSAIAPSLQLRREQEIEQHGEIFGAAIQTVLRRQGNNRAYEIVRQLTQGQQLSRHEMYRLFKDKFENPQELLAILLLNRPLYHLNTSNKHKQQEFEQLGQLIKFGLRWAFSDIDINEPYRNQQGQLADQLQIVSYKATQCFKILGLPVMCEDTGLFITGEEEGILIKFQLNSLKEKVGQTAVFQTVIGIYDEESQQVCLAMGSVKGQIVNSRGTTGFGFDPYFLPNGHEQTLAQAKPLEVNARYLALRSLLLKQNLTQVQAIDEWSGTFQE